MTFISILAVLVSLVAIIDASYEVNVVQRGDKPVLSFTDKTSTFTLPFNPSYIEPTKGTNNRGGLLVRTQNCPPKEDGTCMFCGGSAAKASVLTFSERHINGTFQSITNNSIVFGPYDSTDSWGTEDPRIQYNKVDELYYMFYTAYNGVDIFLSLATSPNPTDPSQWTRHGAVFPNHQNSKSGALLLRDSPPHYLFWGDSSIRIAKSDDPNVWPSEGEIFIQTRADSWDSQLVESGPPPLLLSNGDYIFFYNSAQIGWPQEPGGPDKVSYNAGWVILDGADPSVIKQRSTVPILSPMYDFEYGTSPYTCNVPNVVFLEAARTLSPAEVSVALKQGSLTDKGDKQVDRFEVYFGTADSSIGSAVIEVVKLNC